MDRNSVRTVVGSEAAPRRLSGASANGRGRRAAVTIAHTRREGEIMDVLYRHGHATARQIQEALSQRRSNATVRTQLRGLERKLQVKRRLEGRHYIYAPTMSRPSLQMAALRHMVRTFFDGSVDDAMRGLSRLIAKRSASTPHP